MRSFNKIFVIALPRCATVSMSDALGQFGIRTAHLGKIYGEVSSDHNNPSRLIRMHDQIEAGNFKLEILEDCDGLADYPACCFDVMQQLDQAYPGSLFINVRRDHQITRWLQSVERQFIGLQLLKQRREATQEERQFMHAVLAFREMTFGQSKFDAEIYLDAYHRFQSKLQDYFGHRDQDLLSFADVEELDQRGLETLARFLDCEPSGIESFPCSNAHSELPAKLFMQALESGQIESQTGIKAISRSN